MTMAHPMTLRTHTHTHTQIQIQIHMRINTNTNTTMSMRTLMGMDTLMVTAIMMLVSGYEPADSQRRY